MARSAAMSKTVGARAAPLHDLAILAGGEGRRIGGAKPMRLVAGRPLLAHVIAALSPAASRILLVARTLADSEALLADVRSAVSRTALDRTVPVADRAGLEGPVAGLMGAADAAAAPLLLTAPADAPFLPPALASRLAEGLVPPARSAVAVAGRWHPTVALHETAALRACEPAGSLIATLASLAPAAVPLPEEQLFNVNTPEDLAAAEARAAGRR
jgi:molybdopterin-guanine dinucleotide biosynthesis protein A